MKMVLIVAGLALISQPVIVGAKAAAPVPGAVAMVQPLDRGGFGPPVVLKSNYARDEAGTAEIRAVLLDAGTTDAIREEAFYHLSQRGVAAAPVLLELRAFVDRNPRWQLVYAHTLGAVPDRRLVPELIRLAREGHTPEVRAEAIYALTTDLMNRVSVTRTVTNADGSITTITDGGSMMFCGPIVSHGELLRPGDEQPILRLYRQMQEEPDTVVRERLKGLGATIDDLGPEVANSPAAHRKRLAEVRVQAEQIRAGTTRAEVEKIFTRRDGGLQGWSRTRYYAGEEVMVEVPYDRTGGAWQPTNRVTGAPKVYQSMMHTD